MFRTRSLGGSLTSSWRPFGTLDFVPFKRKFCKFAGKEKKPYLADIICGQTMRNNLSQSGIGVVFFLHVIFQQIMKYC